MSSASGPNAQQKQKALSFFQYGNDAVSKGNSDYAIQMYREACKLDPPNLAYRKAIRDAMRKKFGNEPSKVGRLAGARVQSIRQSRIRLAKAKGQWAHVLELGEEAFVHHPWDVGTARDAAEAATQLGYKELAQWLLESVQAQANDAEFFRTMAQVYQLNENWQRAIQCWERVKQLDPTDEAAARQINSLSASATIARSGLTEALGKHKASASAPETFAPDFDDLKQQAMTPEERLLKEIEENPRVGPFLQLADSYRTRSKLDDAEKILARGLKMFPGDNVLQTAYGEVQVGRLQRAIDKQTKLCQERPDDESARAKLEQLNNYLTEYEIKEFRRQIALQPDDLKLQYELGLRLARAGRHDEAISAFQQARQSLSLRGQALHQSGLSFEATGVMKLAERSYLDALKEAEPGDHPTLNALHYRLGRVAEAQGNTRDAEEHYNEVAANDYGYLDVAQRLRNLGT